MNKKVFVVLMFVIMSLGCVFAAEPISVQLNGEYINFTDNEGNVVNPEIINNRTMVPMRKIFEVVGADIEWDNEERKVTAITEEKVIELQIDNNEAILKDRETNEEKIIELDAAPVLLNSRTMVPVRFIAESLDKQVGWDNENRCVIIIDYSFIEEGLNEHVSNLIEFLNMEKEPIESFKMETKISGDLSYKDGENKKYNEKVKLTGTATFQKTKDNIVKLDLSLKFTGDGEIQKALQEKEYDKLSLSIITDGENTYIKSSTYDTKKWRKADISINMDTNEQVDINTYIAELKIPEDELTIDSYKSIQSVLEIIYELLGNDKLKVIGTTNKSFELSLDIAEVLNKLLKNNANQTLEFLSMGSMNLNYKISYKGSKLNKTEALLDYYMEDAENEESINAKVEVATTVKSLNNNITLKMPKTSEIEK